MIEFILIWIFAWLLIIATLQFKYKGKYWFLRYLFMIAAPITVVALGIASIIVYYAFREQLANVVRDFYVTNFTFLIKGWDYTTVSDGERKTNLER